MGLLSFFFRFNEYNVKIVVLVCICVYYYYKLQVLVGTVFFSSHVFQIKYCVYNYKDYN